MKKLWNQYSYAIILIVLSFGAALLLAGYDKIFGEEDYIKVTVDEGDTLWGLSQQFSDKHKLSAEDFVMWVEEENGIAGSAIQAGEQIMIPVKADRLTRQLQDDLQNFAGE
ncbi:cell division suppressor protein YneA [Bacillus infantis]|uniref:cell division suppressor protein YneA n=1 Tax=Bacillus infantis TaxID=324767 RepID=UPI003CFA82DC